MKLQEACPRFHVNDQLPLPAVHLVGKSERAFLHNKCQSSGFNNPVDDSTHALATRMVLHLTEYNILLSLSSGHQKTANRNLSS